MSAVNDMTSIKEVKDFVDKNVIPEQCRKMKSAYIAEKFHPLSADGQVKCDKGMKVIQKAEDIIKSEIRKLGAERPPNIEVIFGLLQSVPKAENEEEPESCEVVRSTYTFDGKEFRSSDGRCNNVNHPEWGAHGAPLQRLAKPDYEDVVGGKKRDKFGINKPVRTRLRRLLPGARSISIEFHEDKANDDDDHSYLLMQWGQYLDHDVTLSPTVSGVDCEKENSPNCFNIPILSDDPQFGKGRRFERDFIPLTRSAPDEKLNAFHTREQFNELTSFIDSSNVYGSDQDRQENLRVKISGEPGPFLKTIKDGEGKEALPFQIPNLPNECCMGELYLCLQAGDVRASEQPFLSFMHTLWVREHNRIVRILIKLNPTWGPDRLFFEARRIVASVNQHITFDEYLPNLLGGFIFKSIFTPYQGYEPTTNPGAFNEFSHAAYRMGHSQLRNLLARLDENYELLSNITFRQGFFQPARYFSEYEDHASYDNYFRGLIGRNSQQIDRFISEELANHLFEEVDEKGIPTGPGFDLAALNIQRGRDHGLPPYLVMLSQAINFLTSKGLPIPHPLMLPDEFVKLCRIYGPKTFARMDIWVGGLAERAMETALPYDKQDGGQLGPTFTYIIGIQMLHFRDGDRFFYRNTNLNVFDPNKPPVPVLTSAQIESIEATSLATYICSTANNPDTMAVQPQAFRFPQSPLDSLTTPYPPGTRNERKPCSQIFQMEGSKCLDLSPWANDGTDDSDSDTHPIHMHNQFTSLSSSFRKRMH